MKNFLLLVSLTIGTICAAVDQAHAVTTSLISPADADIIRAECTKTTVRISSGNPFIDELTLCQTYECFAEEDDGVPTIYAKLCHFNFDPRTPVVLVAGTP